MVHKIFGFFGILLLSAMATAQTGGMTTDIPVLVCRAKQCALAQKSMTTAFLFNKLVNMLDSNMGADILVCNADPISHVCLENYIALPATAGVAATQLNLPALRLLDAKLAKGKLGLNAILSYYFFVDGRTVPCQNAPTKIEVASQNHVQMYSPGFACQATQTGNATLNAWFLIDYLDFDYGVIGAYYSIGSSQILRAEKTGYTLLRFTKPQKSTVNEINLTPRDPIGGTAILAPNFLTSAVPDASVSPQNQKGATASDIQNLPNTPPDVVMVTPEGQVIPKPQQDAYQRYKQAQEQAAALKAEKQKALDSTKEQAAEGATQTQAEAEAETQSQTTEDQSAWQIKP